MSGDARDFNNIETRAVIKFFFLQGKAPKESHASLTVKNWVAKQSFTELSNTNFQENTLSGTQVLYM
jgi:hypothetical protein